jgi:hypothetical protein
MIFFFFLMTLSPMLKFVQFYPAVSKFHEKRADEKSRGGVGGNLVGKKKQNDPLRELESNIRTESEFLKLKTCSLYHKNLLLQKCNATFTQVLENFYSASDIMAADRGQSHTTI